MDVDFTQEESGILNFLDREFGLVFPLSQLIAPPDETEMDPPAVDRFTPVELSLRQFGIPIDPASGIFTSPFGWRFGNFLPQSLQISEYPDNWRAEEIITRDFSQLAISALEGKAEALGLIHILAESEYATSRGGRIVLEWHEDLKALLLTSDLQEFDRNVILLFQNAFRDFASILLKEGEQGAIDYANAVLYSVGGVVKLLFGKFEQKDPDVALVRHDSIGKPLQSFAIIRDTLKHRGVYSRDTVLSIIGLNPNTSKLGERVFIAIYPQIIASRAKQIPIFVSIPDDLYLRQGVDIRAFDKNMAEVVNNAMKYYDPDKHYHFINISWNNLTDSIDVADNGRGIVDTKMVWKKGYRESVRNPDVSGDGLGLAGVAQRIRKMHWTIELQSQPGHGSVFIMKPRKGDIIFSPSNPEGSAPSGRSSNSGQLKVYSFIQQVLPFMLPETQYLPSAVQLQTSIDPSLYGNQILFGVMNYGFMSNAIFIMGPSALFLGTPIPACFPIY